MDRTKARRILNKKHWTGKEVGQAYLYSLAEDIKAKKENKLFNPPFTRDDLDRMEYSIKTQDQYTIFMPYGYLYSALINSLNIAEGQVQQVYSGFYRYFYTLEDCVRADRVLKALSDYPIIMTNTQYQRIKAEIIEKKMALKTCFYSTVIEYVMEIGATLSKAPEIVKSTIENTKSQLCTNRRILSIYESNFKHDYYNLQSKVESGELLYTTEKIPKLTKYGVLCEQKLILGYADNFKSNVDLEQQKAEFVEDYPTLYKVVVEELKKALPAYARIKEADYLWPLLTYREIWEASQMVGIPLCKDHLDVNLKDILDHCYKKGEVGYLQKRSRLMHKGFIVTDESALEPSQIAENGDYIESPNNPYLFLESIDSIAEDEKRQEQISQYKDYLIEPGLKYVYAYNALIDVIADVYDVDFIDILKKNMSLIESQIKSANNMLHCFYKEVFGTLEEKTRKRKLIKQIFYPIDVEKFLPDEGKIQAVRNVLMTSYGTDSATNLVKDLHALTLKIIGQKDGI